jgi:hypothetical protein
VRSTTSRRDTELTIAKRDKLGHLVALLAMTAQPRPTAGSDSESDATDSDSDCEFEAEQSQTGNCVQGEVAYSGGFKGKPVGLTHQERIHFAEAIVGHSINLVGTTANMYTRGVSVGGSARSVFSWPGECVPPTMGARRRIYTTAHSVIKYSHLPPSARTLIGWLAGDTELVVTVLHFFECELVGSSCTVARVRLFGPEALTVDTKTRLTVIRNRATYSVHFVNARHLGQVVALAPGAPGLVPHDTNHWSVLRHLSKYTDY